MFLSRGGEQSCASLLSMNCRGSSDINLTLGVFYFSNFMKDASLPALGETTDGSAVPGAQGELL